MISVNILMISVNILENVLFISKNSVTFLLYRKIIDSSVTAIGYKKLKMRHLVTALLS